ncbi:hypothetical protein ACIO6U_02765 [Streptomyces sp. NPDC087422]|uniref:hypothetical protein n=1 Tax=Streptomyces sp. NPDC087422 TaxID=3365786 RepID=UPI00382ED2B6
MSTTRLRPSASAPTDSDPDADELLRRARSPRSNLTECPECHAAFSGSAHVCQPKAAPAVDAARLRVETETAYLLRDRQGYDEYRQWAQGAAA